MDGSGHPLKILFYQFFPAGGIGRYTNELASALHSTGEIDVEVACSPDFAYRENAPYRVYPQLASLTHQNAILRKLKFMLAQGLSPAAFLSRARQEGVDIVHFSNINHLTYRFWREQVRRQAYRVAVTVHDVRRKKAILNRAWEERGLRCFYRDADALFVHSQVQLEDLLEFASPDPSRIHIVPHGPYAYPETNISKAQIRANFRIPEARTVGLCFGMVRDDKNVSEQLSALAKMTEDRPFLVVAGKMPSSGPGSEEALRQRIVSLGLEADVLLLNRYIGDDEVGQLYRGADFACLTYKSYFTSQSGVLNVAMHFDCPVLATPAPTLAETVGNYRIGCVCPGDQAGDIVTGLKALLGKLDQGEAFDFAAYRKAHSWQENARQTLAVYRRMIRHEKATERP